MAFRNPDADTYRALATLQSSPEWKTVVAHLRAMLADQDKENRSTLPPQLHQGQGKAQLLEHLIALDEGARDNWRRVMDGQHSVRLAQAAKDRPQMA